MALFLFTRNILEGKPIQIFNHGNHSRDFTYVEDIAEGSIRASDSIAAPDPAWNPEHPNPATSSAPFRLFNIGNSNPVRLLEYVEALEECLGRTAIKEMLPLQPGDIPDTFADVTALARAVNYKPSVPVKEGVRRFVDWYLQYYRVTAP
jgi:UDP-glucuronate 4-epimerase